jgi:hypothetical protein
MLSPMTTKVVKAALKCLRRQWAWAAVVEGVTVQDIDDAILEIETNEKVVNLAVNYGCSAEKLQKVFGQMVDIDYKQIEARIDP